MRTDDLASAPPPGTPVPQALANYAAGRPLELVWLNGAGGLTARISAADGDVYAKWQPPHDEVALAPEVERLTWLGSRHPAPRVVDYARTPEGELLVTEAIHAASAVDPVWVARPADAVVAIAEGLRRLHSLDVNDCPFDWSVEARLAAGAERGVDVADELRDAPPVDRLVVCHGDACVPNTLIGADGRFAATVDVGMLGVADRWADLAVASWSAEWDYGPGWDDLFYDTYGIAPDRERIAYYRALWEAV